MQRRTIASQAMRAHFDEQFDDELDDELDQQFYQERQGRFSCGSIRGAASADAQLVMT